jgi:hypothetical protein
MDFTRFRKSHLLFQIQFFRQALGKFFRFTTKPLVHTKDLVNKERDAIGSLGHGEGGSGQNPAASAAGSAGEREEEG